MFKEIHKAHFIGIGGIGLSAIARMLALRGSRVTGSDANPSRVTEELEKMGIAVSFNQSVSSIPDDVDAVFYTIAIPEEHVELQHARTLGVPLYTYPEALGLLSGAHSTIAISGTHGKTTTTAMTAEVLIGAGLSPTIVVGSFLREGTTNFIQGDSEYLVAEACEYRESFLHLEPYILAITNIEAEHLDYYKDLDDVIRAFNTLALKVPENGYIIADTSDENVVRALEGVRAAVVDYTTYLDDITLSIPGDYNKRNASIALAIAEILEVDSFSARNTLESFAGTWRRFEKKGEREDIVVYDDYAHHPTEIRAVLSGVSDAFSDKNKVVVFQPHLFSRTKLFLKDFSTAFTGVDTLILLPIYKAREIDDGSVSSEDLGLLLEKEGVNVFVAGDFDEAVDIILDATSGRDSLVLTLGAGDVYKTADILLEKI